MDFKVIEFNKESKKIVVSHTRIFEEGDDKPTASTPAPTKEKATGKKGGKEANASQSSQVAKSNNQNAEKSTLGDLDALVALKEKMNKG